MQATKKGVGFQGTVLCKKSNGDKFQSRPNHPPCAELVSSVYKARPLQTADFTLLERISYSRLLRSVTSPYCIPCERMRHRHTRGRVSKLGQVKSGRSWYHEGSPAPSKSKERYVRNNLSLNSAHLWTSNEVGPANRRVHDWFSRHFVRVLSHTLNALPVTDIFCFLFFIVLMWQDVNEYSTP